MRKSFAFCLFLLNLSCVSNKTTHYIAFTSCNDPNQGLGALHSLDLALDTIPTMIWLGDNIYLSEGEWDSDSAIANRYEETFSTDIFKSIFLKASHYAVWDDHDAGPNDCTSDFKGLPMTMKAFKDFWRPSYSMPNANSFYGSTRIGDGSIELFFLDNRSFRTHHDSTNATMLGEEQLLWLEQAYVASNAPVKVLLMGGQLVNPAKVFDNASRYPKERVRLLSLLGESGGLPLVLSGDRHHGEINNWLHSSGKHVYEATASPITAKSFPHHNEHNVYRTHLGTTETNHYGILAITLDGKDMHTMEIQLIDADGNTIFRHRETE